MPDQNGNPLPPLPDEAFEYGETTKAEINLNTKCEHKNAVLNSQKREIRCECGSSWNGFGVEELYKAFKK